MVQPQQSNEPWQKTYEALTSSHLFEQGKSKSQKVYLSVTKLGTGERILTIKNLNMIERIQAWMGFGNSSLKTVNKFLLSNEGQSQIEKISLSNKDIKKLSDNLMTLNNKSLQKTIFKIVFIYSGEVKHDWNAAATDEAEIEKIPTNLIKKHPKWLPQSSVSNQGTLSTENFFYDMKFKNYNEMDPDQQAKLRWFFSQRKFPLTSAKDTIGRRPEKVENERTNPTVAGYAVSLSKHKPHRLVFLEDSKIGHIKECQSVRARQINESFFFPIGIYPDGKTMIQQQAVRGCVAACEAMMLEDRGIKCNVNRLLGTNLATNEDLIGWLNGEGVKAKTAQLPQQADSIQNFIDKHGSLCLGIFEENIKGHQILLDSINQEQATIRDPFHGWRITIATEDLFKMTNFSEVVYIE